MLKRLKSGAADVPLMSYDQVETGLSAVLTQVFDEPVVVRYSAVPHAFTSALPWIVANSADSGEVGIAIGSSLEPVEYFSQLVRLAACHVERGMPLAIKSTWQGTPAKQHCFIASSVAVTREQPIEFFVAATEESLLASTWGQDVKKESYPPHLTCRAELWIPLDSFEAGRAVELKADGIIGISILQKWWGVRLFGRRDRIEAYIESEETMTEETMKNTCSFTLSLGEIELSIEDALRLRAGMVIEFERPQVFEAQLLANGTPWGSAQVELQERGVRLVVRELAWNQASKRRKQETSGSDSRLSSEALSI